MSITTLAEETDQDILVVTEILPPYQVYNENNQLGGYSVEFVAHIFKRMNRELKVDVVPWSRAFRLAKQRKNVVIFSMAKTKEREDSFHWIGRLHQERYALFKLKSNDKVYGASLSNFIKYSVVVARDSVVQDFALKQGFTNIEQASTLRQMLGMLYAGRVNMILESESALFAEIEKTDLDSSLMENVYDVKEFSSDLFISMSKQSDPELVKQFRDAYLNFVNSEEYEAFVRRWQL